MAGGLIVNPVQHVPQFDSSNLDRSWISLKAVYALPTLQGIFVSKIHKKSISLDASPEDKKAWQSSLKDIRKFASSLKRKFPRHEKSFEDFDPVSNPRPPRGAKVEWTKRQKDIACEIWNEVWSWLLLQQAGVVDAKKAAESLAGKKGTRNVPLQPFIMAVNKNLTKFKFDAEFVPREGLEGEEDVQEDMDES